ncbi:hypothetical protein OHS18_13255 [Amycolatopsis sp. NBC_00355]|uniref:hypothetical protein n=1 Tax=Amycolatopsis sp. NBC_00355 TaxID=2975957 RepID=UPI002E272FE8
MSDRTARHRLNRLRADRRYRGSPTRLERTDPVGDAVTPGYDLVRTQLLLRVMVRARS